MRFDFLACFAFASALALALALPASAQSPVVIEQPAAGTSQPVYPITSSNPLPTFSSAGAGTLFGISPVVSGSAEATHVLKATAGNLYSAYATNLTATAGFLVILDATSAPSDGGITPIECVPLPGNATAGVNYASGPAGTYVNGIVAVVTSANTCFTKTTGTITAFIHGLVK